MPVTRDLSPAKRTAILEWLQNVGADGKPLYGDAPAALSAQAPAPARARRSAVCRHARRQRRGTGAKDDGQADHLDGRART